MSREDAARFENMVTQDAMEAMSSMPASMRAKAALSDYETDPRFVYCRLWRFAKAFPVTECTFAAAGLTEVSGAGYSSLGQSGQLIAHSPEDVSPPALATGPPAEPPSNCLRLGAALLSGRSQNISLKILYIPAQVATTVGSKSRPSKKYFPVLVADMVRCATVIVWEKAVENFRKALVNLGSDRVAIFTNIGVSKRATKHAVHSVFVLEFFFNSVDIVLTPPPAGPCQDALLNAQVPFVQFDMIPTYADFSYVNLQGYVLEVVAVQQVDNVFELKVVNDEGLLVVVRSKDKTVIHNVQEGMKILIILAQVSRKYENLSVMTETSLQVKRCRAYVRPAEVRTLVW
jgi:hypothetical protein